MRNFIRLLAGLAVITFACGFQYAYITSGTNGLPLKWAPGTIPVRIMADNTTALSDGTTRATSIQATMTDLTRGWNQYLGNIQFVPQILPAGSGAAGDGLNQIFFSSTPYSQGWEANTRAVTVSWYVGNRRIESDIIFNTAFTWDSYRGVLRSGAVDIQRVAFHELGHVLGLDHPDDAGLTVTSIMNSAVGDTDQIQSYDFLAAQFLYGQHGAPINDTFANATPLVLVNNALSFKSSNTNGTKETGEPNHANNAGGRSAWFKLTTTSSGSLTLTTAGSVFDTTLGVYTGTDVTALSTVASNDNVQNGVVLTSSVTFSAVAGTTYYVAVDGFNAGDGFGADSGGILLNVTLTPTNSVVSETVVTGHSVTFSVTGATGTIQWQVSTNDGLTWTDLTEGESTIYTGVTSPNLTITSVNSGMAGLRYRAVITNGGVSSPSDFGTLFVVQALLSFPAGISIDAVGNLYVTDTAFDMVQKISSGTTIAPLAGSNSTAGSADGVGIVARFNSPGGISSSAAGVLDVADTANATIRVVQPDGTVTTLAGNPSIHGSADATGSAASFNSPIGIARDSAGTLYVADSMNHIIRKVTAAGVVTTFAGSAGSSGSADGTGNAARFNNPTGIAVDASGNVYVADTTNNLLRKITPAGTVTTLAGVVGVAGSTDGTGSAALFNMPGGLAVDASGNIYLADTGNSTVRKITAAGAVSTLAGLPGIAGFKDGNNGDAWFNQPKSLVLDSAGNVYVTDTGNAAIRKITPTGIITTLSLVAGSTATTTTSTTSTIPPTGGTAAAATGGGGGGGAPSTWFFGALGLLAVLRKMLPKRG